MTENLKNLVISFLFSNSPRVFCLCSLFCAPNFIMISAQFVLKSVIVFLTASISAEVIHIKQGDLRGFESESRNGTKYFGFLGIPYAAAPVNELRFQAPQPHHGWPGERDATKEGNICPQPALFPGNQSEDCLNLNVYTPKVNV
uniref:Esterase SG1 n=2 Tax=Cacopsylla melanoneura TaxID=428564 RepID=A0A8D8YK65_9HEMI